MSALGSSSPDGAALRLLAGLRLQSRCGAVPQNVRFLVVIGFPPNFCKCKRAKTLHLQGSSPLQKVLVVLRHHICPRFRSPWLCQVRLHHPAVTFRPMLGHTLMEPRDQRSRGARKPWSVPQAFVEQRRQLSGKVLPERGQRQRFLGPNL